MTATDLLASKFAIEMMEAGLSPIEGIAVLEQMIRVLEEKIAGEKIL